MRKIFMAMVGYDVVMLVALLLALCGINKAVVVFEVMFLGSLIVVAVGTLTGLFTHFGMDAYFRPWWRNSTSKEM